MAGLSNSKYKAREARRKIWGYIEFSLRKVEKVWAFIEESGQNQEICSSDCMVVVGDYILQLIH